jgi:hypothetical protein
MASLPRPSPYVRGADDRARGAPVQIKTLLGHGDIRTTLNIYGHLFPSMESALADAMDSGYRRALEAQTSNVVTLRR